MSTITRHRARARSHDYVAPDENNLRISVIGLNYAPEPTGIAVYTAGLAEGLADRGHRVKAITGIPHYPQWRPYDGFDARTQRETRAGARESQLDLMVAAARGHWKALTPEQQLDARPMAESLGALTKARPGGSHARPGSAAAPARARNGSGHAHGNGAS